jgi:hypothetical protein
MQKRQTIRQTLSLLIVSSSLLAGIVSCKKDKDARQDTPAPAASRLSEYKNGDEFIRLTYNADGTVNKATLKSELNTTDNIVEYTISYSTTKKNYFHSNQRR